ncbi:MAG: hypothetical protein C4B59_05220 [Candidatus Methanogaster sp.]|uniref:Uncharacterized protein n=1 Tax=Candidatus Methanogaster sp. TaxID=3386292 RepID=A0AC61L460_9EURY|nr:MAG: hypothetical protein C4B59_05220 [ANME-2 cluster archaeon]
MRLAVPENLTERIPIDTAFGFLILVMVMRMKAACKDAVLKPLMELDLREGEIIVIDLKKSFDERFPWKSRG